MPQPSPFVDVLVVGAGPTGLVMASELSRHGLRCRLVDKAQEPSDKSRAIAVHSRTLEVLEDLGVIGEVLAAGKRLHGANLYAEGQRLVHLSFDELDAPYPFVLSLPQSHTEAILEGLLARLGRAVERGVE